MTLQPFRLQVPPSSLLRSRATSCFFVICFSLHVGWSQNLVHKRVQPQLAPGQTASGADHPEYFSRVAAFHILLEMLSVQPDDALHLQRRARHISSDIMLLSSPDAFELEQIVEEFRAKEQDIDAQIHALGTENETSTAEYQLLQRSRIYLVHQTRYKMRQRLSSSANQAVDAFMERIISKSTLQAPQSSAR